MAGSEELYVWDSGKKKRLKLILKVGFEHCEDLRVKKKTSTESQSTTRQRKSIKRNQFEESRNYFFNLFPHPYSKGLWVNSKNESAVER